jgi:hypothetical protein
MVSKMRMIRLAALVLLAFSAAAAQFHVYAGDIQTDSALLAWGTTKGRGNTIGRDSTPHGRAVVRIDGREIAVEEKNWVRVTGLNQDTVYAYEIELDGKPIGKGNVRTHPVRSDRVAFLVIGDFGNGSRHQYALGRVMAREIEARRETDNPVRFVLTTGDNISSLWQLGFAFTGDRDRHWRKKFFEPYAEVLREVPFYPTLGNHDGNEDEHREDLAVYLDNFFFPGGEPARWYSFSYGGLVDFFALDTNEHTLAGPPKPVYEPGGEQHRWIERELADSAAPWKIAYFHHPPFSAGPRHFGSLNELRHFHDLLVERRVQAVFNGHAHNLQFTDPDETGGIQYMVAGSGGYLRRARPTPDQMRANKIAGWAAERMFCLVEIRDGRMTVTPISTESVTAVGPDGSRVPLPVVVRQ